MTRDDVIRMALEAGFAHCENYSNGWLNTMERFVTLVAASERQKHQADIERWKAEAATAEKWRGIACSKDGDGRTVQLIQQEAAAAEREACALVCEAKDTGRRLTTDYKVLECASAIRARGAA